MQQIIEDQQIELDSIDAVAVKATPVHFDAIGADHASPVLFDLYDAESDQDGASHASPALNDATTQTAPPKDNIDLDFGVLDVNPIDYRSQPGIKKTGGLASPSTCSDAITSQP
eukprot:1844757-Karenia_brevis.AAC.1